MLHSNSNSSNSNPQFRSLLFGFHRKDFRSLGAFVHSRFFSWLLFLLLVMVLSFILSFQVQVLPSNIQVGRIAPKSIKADRNYEIVDSQATKANREAAYANVLPVYDFDGTLFQEIKDKITEAFRGARLVVQDKENLEEASQVFQSSLGVSLKPALLADLEKDQYSEATEREVQKLLSGILTRPILATRSLLPYEPGRGIMIRDLKAQAVENERSLQNLDAMESLEEIQDRLAQLPSRRDSKSESLLSPAQMGVLISSVVVPNTTFNSVETEFRRARAVGAIPNVILKLQAGEAILRSGDRYEPFHLMILQAIQKQKSETSFTLKFVGTALFVFLLILISYVFSSMFIRKFNPTKKDLYFLGGNLILVLFSVRIAAAFSSALTDFFPYEVSVQSLYYAIPVAGGAMLTRYLLNSEIALVFAIVLSALTGMFLQGDLDLSIYFLISSIVAAAAMARVDRRTAILRAGLLVGVVNALVILAIKLITVVSVTDVFSIAEVSSSMAMGFLGGILASIFVMVMAPIAEGLFHYVTDIQLLELGNLNHPLLRDMIVKAPGTYHHSQLVAVLAEAAAAQIGANPLLARVGSYFHDIGKMRKPAYFIENQTDGVNRHDALSPSMSALIIASHVKDGLELAREYKLPKKISDFIPQHQGTKLISFFYNKALKLNEGKDTPVDEKLYKYPGPRPQTREAGIILLADGVEASVRSLVEKTPQKIQSKVQQIINNNFIEEQLDECDMTLRDLHCIAETFTRVLVGIYHQRIAYPEGLEKKRESRGTVTPLKKVAPRPMPGA